jgi:hypothetical protein
VSDFLSTLVLAEVKFISFILSPLLYLAFVDVVRFEVFKAVTMKNADFWDVTPCGSFKNRRFGGT